MIPSEQEVVEQGFKVAPHNLNVVVFSGTLLNNPVISFTGQGKEQVLLEVVHDTPQSNCIMPAYIYGQPKLVALCRKLCEDTPVIVTGVLQERKGRVSINVKELAVIGRPYEVKCDKCD